MITITGYYTTLWQYYIVWISFIDMCAGPRKMQSTNAKAITIEIKEKDDDFKQNAVSINVSFICNHY